MSKLIFIISFVILASAAFLIRGKESRPLVAQAWGKSRSEVVVRLVEREVKNGTVTLEAEIQTFYDDINVKWQLPTGVTMISGQMTEVLHKTEGQNILRHRVTVQIGSEVGERHLVFVAYKDVNGRRMGQSQVYDLIQPREEAEKVQKIKAMMGGRKIKPTHR